MNSSTVFTVLSDDPSFTTNISSLSAYLDLNNEQRIWIIKSWTLYDAILIDNNGFLLIVGISIFSTSLNDLINFISSFAFWTTTEFFNSLLLTFSNISFSAVEAKTILKLALLSYLSISPVSSTLYLSVTPWISLVKSLQ